MMTQSLATARFYEATRDAGAPAKLAANWVMGELSRRLNAEGKDIVQSPVDAALLADAPDDVVVWSWSMPPHARRNWSRAPVDAAAYAHDLYAVLRDLDSRGAREIWIEQPPSSAAWAGVRDRLTRAAAGSTKR